jgi:hypothetical protein
MALTKETVVDKIEVLENGTLQIRTATRVLENGEVISSSYHRHCLTPGMDCSDECPKVQSIAELIHTPECIAAYEASLLPIE